MEILYHLNKLHAKMDAYNKLTPFPVYDTEYVQAVQNKITEITNSDIDYDDEPVVACKYCDDLHITIEEGSDVCNKCFTVNELKEFKNIFEYKEYLKNKLNGEE